MKAVIGDIHGSVFTLEKLLDKILKNYSIEKFIFLGDLIDRGYASDEVVYEVIGLSDNYDVILLLGNHEDMMLDYVFEENRYEENVWFQNGGYSTVKSISDSLYNNIFFNNEDIREELKIYFERELEFLKSSKLYYSENIEDEILFFSHAGIEFPNASPYKQLDYCKTEFDREIKHPYIWSREVDFFEKKIDNFIFIHGHTPTQYVMNETEPLINKDDKGNIISINIDTGCVYGGALTAMLYEDYLNFEFIMEKWK